MLCLTAGFLSSSFIIRGDFGTCGKVCVYLYVIGFIGLTLLPGLMVGDSLRLTTWARSRIEFVLFCNYVLMFGLLSVYLVSVELRGVECDP